MTTTQLRDWIFTKDLEDNWCYSADGVEEEERMTLAQIEQIARNEGFAENRVLHVSQREMAAPPWVDLEIEFTPASTPTMPMLGSTRLPTLPDEYKIRLTSEIYKSKIIQSTWLPKNKIPVDSSPRILPGEAVNPGLAAVMSFFIPGLGQIYSARVGYGLVCFVVCCIAYFFIIILGVFMHIWLIFNAYNSAKRHNAGIRQ